MAIKKCCGESKSARPLTKGDWGCVVVYLLMGICVAIFHFSFMETTLPYTETRHIVGWGLYACLVIAVWPVFIFEYLVVGFLWLVGTGFHLAAEFMRYLI